MRSLSPDSESVILLLMMVLSVLRSKNHLLSSYSSVTLWRPSLCSSNDHPHRPDGSAGRDDGQKDRASRSLQRSRVFVWHFRARRGGVFAALRKRMIDAELMYQARVRNDDATN